jgi:pyruvate dehydrogenase E2 component (dihydrolipoamide acetyltransferase)
LSTGDILCDIETDKASVGFELQDDGFLAKILNNDPTLDMKVGDMIAIIVDDEADIAAFADYVPGADIA